MRKEGEETTGAPSAVAGHLRHVVRDSDGAKREKEDGGGQKHKQEEQKTATPSQSFSFLRLHYCVCVCAYVCLFFWVHKKK